MDKDYSEEELYLGAEKKVKNIKGFYRHLFLYLIVNIIWIIILINLNEVPSFSQYGFWGMGYGYYATALFWGIGILAHWLGVFGIKSIFSKEWEKRKIQELIDKDNNKTNEHGNRE